MGTLAAMAKKKRKSTPDGIWSRIDAETLEVLRKLEEDWPNSVGDFLKTSRSQLLRLIVKYVDAQIEEGELSLRELVQRELDERKSPGDS